MKYPFANCNPNLKQGDIDRLSNLGITIGCLFESKNGNVFMDRGGGFLTLPDQILSKEGIF